MSVPYPITKSIGLVRYMFIITTSRVNSGLELVEAALATEIISGESFAITSPEKFAQKIGEKYFELMGKAGFNDRGARYNGMPHSGNAEEIDEGVGRVSVQMFFRAHNS
jgi:hypothetical protein